MDIFVLQYSAKKRKIVIFGGFELALGYGCDGGRYGMNSWAAAFNFGSVVPAVVLPCWLLFEVSLNWLVIGIVVAATSLIVMVPPTLLLGLHTSRIGAVCRSLTYCCCLDVPAVAVVAG